MYLFYVINTIFLFYPIKTISLFKPTGAAASG
jgi:hypothetical protein